MFSLLIDKLPFFAAIFITPIFYYHKRISRFFYLQDMIILPKIKVNMKLALFSKEC